MKTTSVEALRPMLHLNGCGKKLWPEAFNDFVGLLKHQDETGTCVRSPPNFNMVDIFKFKKIRTYDIYIYII
jgi:hypothetical protein